MEVKRVRVTNRKQFELLVNRLKAKPAVARGQKFCEATGINRDSYAEIWKEMTIDLNSLGPPIRTEKDWQKVWTDYKIAVKNKLAHNKREANATGGGPNTMKVLSPTEEDVATLLSLDKLVNHSGSVFGLPRRTPSPPSSPLVHRQPRPHHDLSPPGSPLLSSTMQQQFIQTGEENPFEEEAEELENGNNNHSSRIASGRKRRNPDNQDARHELLVKQTEYMKQIVEHTGECALYAQKMVKLKEEEVKNQREYMLQKHKDRKDELEFKMEMLKYKKKKLDMLDRKEKKVVKKSDKLRV